jgi:hypothetical protein
MFKYEIGKKFPHPNPQPGAEHCRAQLVGSSFDVLYFITRARKQDIRTFRESLLRMYVYIEEHVPFLTFAFFGTPWTFDLTITTASGTKEEVEQFLQPGNAVTLFLIDSAPENTLLAGRLIGLPEEAEKLIKEVCRQQWLHQDAVAVDRTIKSVYAKYTPQDLMKKSQMWEFKR